jgi:isoquinoline 1-oxidoreductase beta subunit
VSGYTRRDFVVLLAGASGGLLLGCRVGGGGARAATAGGAEVFSPNAFIAIGRDGIVTLVMNQVEMGQGVYTAMPMLVAEELEVGLDQVRLEHAPPDVDRYANPALGWQVTGGSTSIRAHYLPLRRAGAAAKTMLVAAAAETWGVEPAACRAHAGSVIHGSTGRTLTYGALADKAATMRVPDEPVLKDPREFTLIGTPARRLDAPDKVNGKAVYSIDVRLPGMKVATVTASPVFGGTLARVDDAPALAVPGVRQVVRLENAVAVVGDHMWAARQGLAALRIEWNDGEHGGVGMADVVGPLEAATREGGATAREEGDAEAALAGAASRVEAVYEMPFLAHATMEPVNCTVHVRPDACEVWVGTQVATRARATAAEVTGLSEDQVIVHNHLLGGGFGRRLEVDFITRAVEIAKQVEGPVKVVYTREEDIRQDMYRPYYHDRLAAALDSGGRPVAWTHRIAGSSILARWAELTPRALRAAGLGNIVKIARGVDLDAVDGAAELPYDIPAIKVEYSRQEPPGIPTAFWRGVGPTHNIFVVESFMDELAAAAKQDPVAYRRALLGKAPRALAALELAAKEAGWGEPLPTGRGRGVSVQHAFGTWMAQVAEVEVAKDGAVRVHRVVCAVDCGVVINPDTVRAQVESGIIFGITAALHGEITLEKGRVKQSNFHDYRMLRINEAPEIAVHLVPSTEHPGGMGEPGTSAVAPAVTNAIFAATGTRVRKLPVRLAALTA